MKENTFVDILFFHFDLFLTHCFYLLSAFLISKPFQNNYIHFEIIDHCFNVFFRWNKTEKEKTWKVFFGWQNLGAQTGIPVSKTAWTHHCHIPGGPKKMHPKLIEWCLKVGIYKSKNLLNVVYVIYFGIFCKSFKPENQTLNELWDF